MSLSLNALKIDKYFLHLYGLQLALHVLFSQTGYGYSAGLFGGLVTPRSIKQIYEDAKKEAQVWFDRIVAKFYEPRKQQEWKSEAKLSTEVVVTATSIVAAIVEYAEEHNVDLLVIGSRGRSGFNRCCNICTLSSYGDKIRCSKLYSGNIKIIPFLY